MSLKNKVIWITGASSGIGEAIAKELSKDDPVVILSARNVAELERVKKECNSKNVHILSMDVTEIAKIESITKSVIDQHGKIDILINNAGISQRANVVDTDLEVDRKIMEVNYFAKIALTKATLPYMIQQEAGLQVVISSVAGKIGVKARSAYCASKHAIQGFYESLRAEVYDQNVKVTIICPGYVQTNISTNALKGDGSRHHIVDENIAEGLTAAILAQKAVAAIKAEKEEIIIAKSEGKAVLLGRFFPNQLRKMVRNRTKH